MSKQIKQMQMDAIKHTFQDVRDLVALSISKLDCQGDNQFRAALAKKNIRLQMVKNSLARRVFAELGMKVDAVWAGPTTFAWGAGSLAELSQEIDKLTRKNDRFKIKGAISEGQDIPFPAALAMPTRAQALGRVVSLALAPASRLLSQILAPAATVVGQIKTISEKSTEAAPAEAATAPAAG